MATINLHVKPGFLKLICAILRYLEYPSVRVSFYINI